MTHKLREKNMVTYTLSAGTSHLARMSRVAVSSQTHTSIHFVHPVVPFAETCDACAS